MRKDVAADEQGSLVIGVDVPYFPFQHALVDENEARSLLQGMWADVDAVRSLPIILASESAEEDVGEVWD